MKVSAGAPPVVAPVADAPSAPMFRRLLEAPGCGPGLSLALLKAAALELVILAGHLLLYPSGITQERPGVPTVPTVPAVPADPAIPAVPAQPDRRSADTPRLPAAPRPPVLLLHGLADNRSVFVLLRRRLAQHGRHVECRNHSPLTGDIRKAAESLGRHVEELCARTGHRRVDLVGHSLGGLVARYYVQRLGGDARVRTVVTLGTPHSGTRAVPPAGALPVVRQMRPGSGLVEELRAPAPGCRTRFVSFWSDLDQVMVPRDAARIDHPDLLVRNVRVTGIGHLALPVHPAVAEGVREALDTDAADFETGSSLSGSTGTPAPENASGVA